MPQKYKSKGFGKRAKGYTHLNEPSEEAPVHSGCFTNLLFNWCKPTLRLGKQRPLNFEDLPPLP